MSDPNEISETEFYEVYRPIENPRDQGEGWEWEDLVNAGLITSDKDSEGNIPVDDPDFRRIWTVTGNNALTAAPGFHSVDRVYYIVTEKPWNDMAQWTLISPAHCGECGEDYEDEDDMCWEEDLCWSCCSAPKEHKEGQKED